MVVIIQKCDGTRSSIRFDVHNTAKLLATHVQADSQSPVSHTTWQDTALSQLYSVHNLGFGPSHYRPTHIHVCHQVMCTQLLVDTCI